MRLFLISGCPKRREQNQTPSWHQKSVTFRFSGPFFTILLERGTPIPCEHYSTILDVAENKKHENHNKFSTSCHYQIHVRQRLRSIEGPLRHCQPQEQHGLRNKCSIKEHVLTTNMLMDKMLWANKIPVEHKFGLVLQYVFDRVDWDAVWIPIF